MGAGQGDAHAQQAGGNSLHTSPAPRPSKRGRVATMRRSGASAPITYEIESCYVCPAPIRVTAAAIMKGSRLFAARRAPGKHLAGFWELPGGKVEDGEEDRLCLARELREELGIEVEVGPHLGDFTHDYGDKVITLAVYEVPFMGGEMSPVDHDEICWLPPPEFDSVEWAPADIPVVGKLFERFG